MLCDEASEVLRARKIGSDMGLGRGEKELIFLRGKLPPSPTPTSPTPPAAVLFSMNEPITCVVEVLIPVLTHGTLEAEWCEGEGEVRELIEDINSSGRADL